MKRLLAALALGLAMLVPAYAQTTPTPAPYSVLGGQTTLSVSNSSSSVALPATIIPYGAVTVFNTGTADAYMALGDSTVVATTSSTLIKAGMALTVWANTATYIAGITASSTATFVVYQATGPVNLVGAAAETIPGTVTANQGTTPWIVGTSDPCTSAAKSSAAISVTSATTTSLVAVSGSTTVYVCGFAMSIAPSATSADLASFEYGTGAACTSPTALTGTFGNGDLTSAAAVVPVTYGGGTQTVFKSAASAGICIVTAGTAVNVQGVLTYVQQ